MNNNPPPRIFCAPFAEGQNVMPSSSSHGGHKWEKNLSSGGLCRRRSRKQHQGKAGPVGLGKGGSPSLGGWGGEESLRRNFPFFPLYFPKPQEGCGIQSPGYDKHKKKG